MKDINNSDNEYKKRSELLSMQIDASKIIMEQINKLMSSEDFDAAVNDMLAKIGLYLKSDRMYIFERNGNEYSNIFEWCNEGVQSVRDKLQNVPENVLGHWIKMLKNGENVYIQDLEDIKETLPDVYRLLERKNIKSLVLAPVMAENKMTGFLGVDNAPSEITSLIIYCLAALGSFIGARKEIFAEKEQIVKQNFKLSQEKKRYREALSNNCEYCYSFDLTEGLIPDNFMSKHGIDIIKEFGFKPPIAYNVLNEKYISKYKIKVLNRENAKVFTIEGLMNEYNNGITNAVSEYYSPVTDRYTRVTALMSEDEPTGHVYAVIIGNDITEEKKREERQLNEIIQAREELTALNEALKTAYESASKANLAKTHFLANMSHDIRTPLNAIIGMTAIAGTHLDDRERVTDCLSKITVSSRHLLGLINEVLDMSKIESGKLDLNDEAFSISDVVDNLFTMMKPQIDAKKHDLKISINGIIHEKVIGDCQRLEQIFTNLMSNAIKYTPEGGKIRLKITEKPMNKPKLGCYEFIFEDNGIGMDEEFQKHFFEPFERAADSRVDKIQGTGLGMAITKNVVQMMNGSIDLESRLNEGTKITVTILLKLQNENEEISYEEFVDLPVLVADDDKDACETTCMVLSELGMKSEWVLSGEEAVKKVVLRHEENDDFFAVIFDWKMPEMDGIEATRQIRRLVGNEVPIIIISAYDWSDIEAEAREAGASAFISKPLFKSRMAYVFSTLLGCEKKEEEKNSLDKIFKDNFVGKRALLVEDNDINAEIAIEVFKMAGLEVDLAKNGREALDIMSTIDDGYYDIVFMDIQMPIMNGYETAAAIRSLPGHYQKNVPIIAMTANTFSEDIKASIKAGMNEHVAKPFNFKQIMEVLNKWLD